MIGAVLLFHKSVWHVGFFAGSLPNCTDRGNRRNRWPVPKLSRCHQLFRGSGGIDLCFSIPGIGSPSGQNQHESGMPRLNPVTSAQC